MTIARVIESAMTPLPYSIETTAHASSIITDTCRQIVQLLAAHCECSCVWQRAVSRPST